MSGACVANIGEGVIRGVLFAVDCQTRDFAQGGYTALTGGGGVFQAALTAVLVIYVALTGYRLLFASGGARLSDGVGVALSIGLVLALVTSWSTFQTLVFDLASRAPKEVAALAAAPLQGDASSLAANPVDGLQTAYDQLTAAAVAFGRQAGPNARAFSNPQAAAAEALSTATGAIFMGGAGLIAVATIAVGVLTAVGPVFIVMFLIPATRGLFIGWVRALAAAALAPMGAWIINLMMLLALEPWLVELAQQRRTDALDPQTAVGAASIVMVFTAAQAALLIAAGVIAFSFKPTFGRRRRETSPDKAPPVATATSTLVETSRAQALAWRLQSDQVPGARRTSILRETAMSPTVSGRSEPSEVRSEPRLGNSYRRPQVRGRQERSA
jgi:type IV secretion system protein VirB6